MTNNRRTARIGVDVGGTFTDLVLYDPVRNIMKMGKLLTTPDDASIAIIDGIKRILADAGLTAGDLQNIVHGTTLVTNTIIERKGARVGLLTTRGFRDTIEIGRETRYDLYDLFIDLSEPLVPRSRRLEIPERKSSTGETLLSLDENAVAEAIKILVEKEKIDALAISFMHSYVNGEHELRAGEIVKSIYPDLKVSLSAQVAPEIREYERSTTACANAYVQPLMVNYLDRLERSLADLGFDGKLYIMLSGGGITTIEEVKQFPIRIIESGPAAGAMTASLIASLTGLDRVISFDMGGTTAKMCLIEDGKPDHKFDFEAGRLRRFAKGSGLPLKISVTDMIEIGAGGGSLARVDAGSGLMKVGPQSAGSKPGPVCYGRGGTEPTVTDADLILGHLDPNYFLGGEMHLKDDAVRVAFDRHLGREIGVSVDDAAHGVRRIVDDTMAAATRMHCAEKGRDPRRYAMIAFGGAGPVHAWNLARLMKLDRLVVPLGAGVASALGFLAAPPATDMVRSYIARLDRMDWQHVNHLFAEMVDYGRRLLVEAGADANDIVYTPTADMRYVGQGFEIPVPLPSLTLSADDIPAIRDAFVRSYCERFERAMDGTAIEAISWRLACSAPGYPIDVSAHFAAAQPNPVPHETRAVRFEGAGWQDCPVYNRYALPKGTVIKGPALLEERESTCVVGPDSVITIDEFLNAVIDIGETHCVTQGEVQAAPA